MAAAQPREAAAQLRSEAEQAAAALPALLVKAERLAATIVLGAHGRRRAGVGETFWQYRRATPGDPLGSIDWRRSARADNALFVRETEWEAAQTVQIWCDRALSMTYASAPRLPSKGARAAEITAALAVLLNRAGERISALGAAPETGASRIGVGEAHLARVVGAFSKAASPRAGPDFGAPPAAAPVRGGRVVFVSDFFGAEAAILDAMSQAAALGAEGALLQVCDPAEESFPFDGRVVFESMGAGLRYETERAAALKRDYLRALEGRRARLRDAASRLGWRFATHRTDEAAAPALLWLAQALSQSAFGASA